LYPFIHIGPLELGTYGILVAIGTLIAYFVLRADMLRRKLPDVADTIILVTALAGIVGAKLYHVLERPADLFAHPAAELFSREGFAWAGGLIAGILSLLWLARHYKIPIATMFDVAAPAAALGYAIGRIGCLVSGDGDYGIPTSLPWGMSFPNGLVPTTERVHPTPIYEFLVGLVIFLYLWKLGSKSLRKPRPQGEVIAEYFIWTGLARFLVEFIRINPRSVFGLFSNAQLVAFLSMIVGVVILFYIRRGFKGEKQEHRILRHSSQKGDVVQPEYHKATAECPNPERWRMFDSMTAEVEVLEFLQSLVTTTKPQLIVETGTFMGISTLWMAEGVKQNGFGKIVTCEFDPLVYAKARERIQESGLKKWIDLRNESSLEMKVNGPINIFFSDSAIEIREQEVRYFLPQMSSDGLILMHDASSHLKTVREAALKMEQEGLISVLLMPTPRGLVLAQKRA
jgi:prolipoprotein diacylglyceryl transferase